MCIHDNTLANRWKRTGRLDSSVNYKALITLSNSILQIIYGFSFIPLSKCIKYKQRKVLSTSQVVTGAKKEGLIHSIFFK